jgi:hypothetical protein
LHAAIAIFFWCLLRTFMGFPGTFTHSKSRLRSVPGNQAQYWPNRPGNKAPGRSASMLTRTASRGRHSTKFRCTLYPHSTGGGLNPSKTNFD